MKKEQNKFQIIPRLPMVAVEKLKRAQKIKSKKEYDRKRSKQEIINEE